MHVNAFILWLGHTTDHAFFFSCAPQLILLSRLSSCNCNHLFRGLMDYTLCAGWNKVHFLLGMHRLSEHQSAPTSKTTIKPTNHVRPRHPKKQSTRSLHVWESYLDLNLKKCDISLIDISLIVDVISNPFEACYWKKIYRPKSDK